MKILIADDHAIIREGIKMILTELPEIDEICEAENGLDALRMISGGDFTMAILDISMPGLSGIDILSECQRSGNPIRILILSIHPQEEYAMMVFSMGASGYLSKSDAYQELKTAIRKVADGGKYVSPSLADRIIFNMPGKSPIMLHETLSEREFQVLLHVGRGKSVAEIAETLSISVKTVNTYRYRLLEKMKVRTNAELILYAIRHGLVT